MSCHHKFPSPTPFFALSPVLPAVLFWNAGLFWEGWWCKGNLFFIWNWFCKIWNYISKHKLTYFFISFFDSQIKRSRIIFFQACSFFLLKSQFMPYIMIAVIYLQPGHPFTIFTVLWMDFVTVTVRYTIAFVSFQNIRTKQNGGVKIKKILQTFFSSQNGSWKEKETFSIRLFFFTANW